MQLGLSLVFHLCFSLYISLILSSQFLPNDWKSSCLQLPYSHFSFLTPKRVCLTSLSANSKRSKGMIKIEPYFIISSAQTSSPLAEQGPGQLVADTVSARIPSGLPWKVTGTLLLHLPRASSISLPQCSLVQPHARPECRADRECRELMHLEHPSTKGRPWEINTPAPHLVVGQF